MALSYVAYTAGAAATDFTFSKGYIQQSDVKVYVDSVLQTLTTDYTWFNATTVRFVTPMTGGETVLLDRETNSATREVDFQDAGNLTEADLDLSANQMFYLAQEAIDDFNDKSVTLTAGNEYTAGGLKIIQVADGVDTNDAVNKGQLDAIPAAAAASAAAALASETAAAASETAAGLSETAAAASETAAGASETAAAASAAAAATSYDDFDDRYLGAKASDPTLDNDGDPLTDGAMYFNTTTNEMKVYDLGITTWAVFSGITQATADTLYQPLDTDLSAIAALAPTKGRLMVGNGSAWVDFGVGTDGQVIEADSAQAKGIKWATKAAGASFEKFVSAGQTSWGVRTSYSYAHGLSGTPHIVQAYLECTTAEHGYAIGDRVYLEYDNVYLNNEYNVLTYANATNIVAVTAQAIVMNDSTVSGNSVTFTNTSWTLYVSAIYLG